LCRDIVECTARAKSEREAVALTLARTWRWHHLLRGGDTVTAGRPRVKPGDTILVHAGLYKYHPEFYTGDRTINATTPFEGTYYLTASGTADRPIAIKGAGDGEVIFDGNGNVIPNAGQLPAPTQTSERQIQFALKWGW